MRHRTKALSGKLTVESKAESGTVVTFEMPLLNVSRV
jgi:signal transduction histidine kinase